MNITQDEIARQYAFMDAVLALHEGRTPKCYVDTYGCQQNEADSDSFRGMAMKMGYTLTDDPSEAELFIVNTCAIRDHAEQRVLSNVGGLLRYYKKGGPAVICVAGCMTGQAHMTLKLQKSFPAVRVILNTHALWQFPEALYLYKTTGQRQVFCPASDGVIAEGLPLFRSRSVRGNLPISYGCNNFCSYCVVPYVRGRERSRRVSDILSEAERMVSEGYKEITLLGQNVNSYKGEAGEDFSDLLTLLCRVEGDFTLRFMTSHPKDASKRLFDTMAREDKIAKALHLPVQSGSDAVLSAMNRGYTAGKYRELVLYARSVMPALTLTSDIIVGFPTEAEADFFATMALVEEIGFDALYMFIYSRRAGTAAEKLENCTAPKVISARFSKLLARQDAISHEKSQRFVGQSIPVLFDELREGRLHGRSEGGLLTIAEEGCAAQVGQTLPCLIERTTVRALYGKVQI